MRQAVKIWYDEILNYDNSSAKCKPCELHTIILAKRQNKPPFKNGTLKTLLDRTCSHFTQLVWRNSGRLGLGQAKARSGSKFTQCTVALYDPKGNVGGESNYRHNIEANESPISSRVIAKTKSEKAEKKVSRNAGIGVGRQETTWFYMAVPILLFHLILRTCPVNVFERIFLYDFIKICPIALFILVVNSQLGNGNIRT